MGDKIAARKQAAELAIPILAGNPDPIKDKNDAIKLAQNIGFPLIIKAAFGGGGRGMRVVNDEESLPELLNEAQTEALNAFGDDSVFLERFVKNAKHIEVQIIGDQHGNVVHLHERDCSVQRRHQKVIEIAPSINISDTIREELCSAAVKIAKSIKHKRSRRLLADRKGAKLDLRKIVSKSLAYEGYPIKLYKKSKPKKPMRIVSILDISGSMKVYSQIFLTFVKGLVGVDQSADVYLFHTRLMRVTEYLKENDTLNAVNRISLLTEGFSGGTKIGKSLKEFNNIYSKNNVNGRTVVIIISEVEDLEIKLVSTLVIFVQL